MTNEIRDYDMTLVELVKKYGHLTYNEHHGHYTDKRGRVRRINNTRANGDLMDEMEAGLIFDTLDDDLGLTLEKLTVKYGQLTLHERGYYVDVEGIIRRILPYRPLMR